MGRSQIPREVRRLAERLQKCSGDATNAKSVVMDQITSDRLGKEQTTPCSSEYRLEIALEDVGLEFCQRWASENLFSPANTVHVPFAAARIAGAGTIWKEEGRGFAQDAGLATASHW